ncbi:MAG: hypothetical protein CMK07_08535 [Ponticaulis sp.]|nr:hypothetical protein [Ponticaulis sp.]
MRWICPPILVLVLVFSAMAEGDVFAGQQRFAICSNCHGQDAMGIPSIGTPRLAGQRPYYLKRQLQNFQAGIRGSDDRDEKGKMMRPMSLTLPDEQAIDDVVAYIASIQLAEKMAPDEPVN